ncbi:MAG TPA: YkgJ family cysteine cluster protein [Methanotrichaceae archaeon]|nr:YkgJ family cysteine cluster protein [Methanotrichaceae archaeon]
MPRVFVKAVFEDIRFECQRCGSCCHHKRPLEFDDLVPMERLQEFVEKSNLIYLTEKDIENISSKAGLSPKDFVDTLYEYDGRTVRVEDSGTKVVLDLPVMKSKQDTTCIFYEEGCKIYPQRPRACKLFPFRVEEKSTPEGDIVLGISYNPSCPGIGKGDNIDRSKLEKLVVDQFLQRSKEIAPQVQRLNASGKIAANAMIYRTLPGRRQKD